MLLVLLILIPLVAGILNFTIKGNGAKSFALLSALVSLVLAGVVACQWISGDLLPFNMSWIASIGASFAFAGSTTGILMILLTAIVFVVTFLILKKDGLERSNAFYGFMQLAQAGLMGVFLANDLLLFYFFWELALIPVYFLCSQWGGDRKVRVTFKFFIYTFLGSLVMLGGILYLYMQTPNHTFSYDTILATGQSLPVCTQQIIFVAFFIAFAIKMPVFPFHTWQPDTYEQSYTPITIILSAVMVKMGLFATMKWVLPVFPEGVDYFKDIIIILSLIGLVYASIIAMIQTDIKRIIAYSSIAHIALMVVGLFSLTDIATNGVIVQMFNHGISITGMWLVVYMVEERYGTRNIKELGGLATVAPYMTIAFVIIAFANIALPLTNGFIGEFMIFHGIFESANPHHITYMVIGGLGIILGAIYTLNAVQKVAYGNVVKDQVKDINKQEALALVVIIAIIIAVGVYPNLIYQFLM